MVLIFGYQRVIQKYLNTENYLIYNVFMALTKNHIDMVNYETITVAKVQLIQTLCNQPSTALQSKRIV